MQRGNVVAAGSKASRWSPRLRQSRGDAILGWAHEVAPVSVAVLLACLVVLTAGLPQQSRWIAVLMLVIVFGIPHGALDGELARTWIRPRFGRLWLLVFSVPYLALTALVLVIWRLMPLTTLAGFLAMSVWHFGSEDAEDGGMLEKLTRGGLPVLGLALLHPAGVDRVFSVVSGVPLAGQSAAWLQAASWLWVVGSAAWIAEAVSKQRWHALGEAALLLIALAALPPLTGFALYFVCVHAPRHMLGLVEDARASRVRNLQGAVLLSIPVTLLTVAIGAMLWPVYLGGTSERLLALTLQGLSALTLPHIILDWVTRSNPGQFGSTSSSVMIQ